MSDYEARLDIVRYGVSAMPGAVVLGLLGPLELNSRQELYRTMLQHVRPGVPALLLECSELTQLTEEALGTLLGMYRLLKGWGVPLYLVAVPERIAALLAQKQVERLIPSFDDLESAIEELTDVKRAREALAEAEEQGTKPWEEVKAALGMSDPPRYRICDCPGPSEGSMCLCLWPTAAELVDLFGGDPQLTPEENAIRVRERRRQQRQEEETGRKSPVQPWPVNRKAEV